MAAVKVSPSGFRYTEDEPDPSAVYGRRTVEKVSPSGFRYTEEPEPTPEEITNLRYMGGPPPMLGPKPSGEGVIGAAAEVARPVARLIDLLVSRPAGATLKGLEVAAAHPLRTLASPSLPFRAAKEQYRAPESEGVLTLLARQAAETGGAEPVIPSTQEEIAAEGKRRSEFVNEIMNRGLAGPAAYSALQFAEAGIPATAPLVAAGELAAAAGKRAAAASRASARKIEELLTPPKVQEVPEPPGPFTPRPQRLDLDFLMELQNEAGSPEAGKRLYANAIQELAAGAPAGKVRDVALSNARTIRYGAEGKPSDLPAVAIPEFSDSALAEKEAGQGVPGVSGPITRTRPASPEAEARQAARIAAEAKVEEGAVVAPPPAPAAPPKPVAEPKPPKVTREKQLTLANISEAEASAAPEAKPAFSAAKAIVSESTPKLPGQAGSFRLFSTEMGKKLQPSIDAIRDGFVNITERARQSELAGKISSGILKGAHLMGDAKGMFSYGVPRNFEEANLRRMSNIQLGRDTVNKIASDIAPDRGPWVKFLFGTKRGQNEEDYLAVGQVRNREWSTPEIEKAIGDMFDSMPGGRKGALERMQAIRETVSDNLGMLPKDTSVYSGEVGLAIARAKLNLESRIKDLDAKIERLSTGDKVEVRADEYSRRIGELVLPSIRDDFANGKRLVDLGSLTEEAFLNEAGKYQWRWRGPRGEESAIPEGELFRAMRLRGPFLKARLRDLTEEQQAKIVTNVPEFLYRTRAVQEKVYAADHNFFSELAGFQDVSSATEVPGWKRLVMDKSGRPARTPRDVDMGKTRQLYGDLAGKYVEPKSYAQLMETFDPKNRNWALKLFDLTQQGWGFGKVVLNPATHARNVYADVMMAWTAGVWPWELFTYGAAASRELVGKGLMYQEAVRAGMAPHSYGSGEAMLFDNALAQAGREAGSAGEQFVTALHRAFTAGTQLPGIRHLSRMYQYEDNIFRMLVYTKAREAGMTPIEAVRHVDKYIPDYRQVSKVWDSYGRRLYPLNTFNYKMTTNLPNLMTAGVIGGSGKRFIGERQRVGSLGLPAAPAGVWTSDVAATARFYAGFAAYYGLKKMSEETGGVTPEGWAATQELSPDYVKDGMFLPLQVKDNRGVWTALDLTYTNPWGSVATAAKRAGHSDVVDFLRSVAPSTPIAQAVLSASYGFDYSGRRIWSDALERSANAGDKASKEERSRRLQSYWVDAFLPSIFSSTPKRIAAAAKGEEFRGRLQTLPQALIQSGAGITTQTLKPKEAAARQALDVEKVARSEAFEQSALQRDIGRGAQGSAAAERIKEIVRMRQVHQDRLRRIQYLHSLIQRGPQPAALPQAVNQ